MQQHKQEKTFWVKIYMSGDLQTIKNECRKYCYAHKLCVTVSDTLFIYTGGEEFGVEIGLLNYPRFPSTEDGLIETAIHLAQKCRDAASQWSYLVVTPDHTYWHSNRVE